MRKGVAGLIPPAPLEAASPAKSALALPHLECPGRRTGGEWFVDPEASGLSVAGLGWALADVVIRGK